VFPLGGTLGKFLGDGWAEGMAGADAIVTGVSEAIGSGPGGDVSFEQPQTMEPAASRARRPTKRIGRRKLVFTERM
jgi:hypothetical protein